MADRSFDLTLDPQTAYRIAELMRERTEHDVLPGAEDGLSEAFGDEPIMSAEDALDEGMRPAPDAVTEELEGLIDGLNVDAQHDILALIWVGRGDHTAKTYADARRQARETEPLHVASYLEETPLAADFLTEGLEALGYPQSDYAD